MKKVIISMLCALMITSQPTFADPIAVGTHGGTPNTPVNDTNPVPSTCPSTQLAGGTSTNVTVTTSTQTVTLTSASMNLTINNTSSNSLYFNPFGGAASDANFVIGPGQAFTWSSRQALRSFTLYASGSGTVVGILAH